MVADSYLSRFGVVTGRDMAVDLGTANTLVYVRGEGIVLDEPSVVAINIHDGKPLAVGLEAKKMIGRTPSHIQAIRPLKDGVIADFEICEKMLRYFIQKVHQRKWVKPRMVIAVPSGITGVEQRAVQEAAEFAGARKPAYIIEEPMAAAIGAGLPVQEPTGNMIVDIGGGTTEVAVISLGGVVASQSARVGGDELDNSIIQYIKKEFSLGIGERTAEEIKMQMGSEPVSAICDAVKSTLDNTPPELAADIMDCGITIAGGGALLQGIRERLNDETGMPIILAPDPLYAVAIGSGQVLEEFEALRGVVLSSGEL